VSLIASIPILPLITDTPLKKSWSLTERPGSLGIFGGPYDLASPECPSLLLRKQQEFYDTWRVVLDFSPEDDSWEAGVTLWSNIYSYVSIGIRRNGVGRKLLVKSVLHPKDAEVRLMYKKLGGKSDNRKRSSNSAVKDSFLSRYLRRRISIPFLLSAREFEPFSGQLRYKKSYIRLLSGASLQE
jgi:beta-xylosidase